MIWLTSRSATGVGEGSGVSVRPQKPRPWCALLQGEHCGVIGNDSVIGNGVVC